MNVHTPEHGKDEPFAMYKARRQLSRIQLYNMTHPLRTEPMQLGANGKPNKPASFWFLGQHECSQARTTKRDAVAIWGRRQYKRLTSMGRAYNTGLLLKQAT